jgi:glycosyltransferase involved in cell wall biosynthesis
VRRIVCVSGAAAKQFRHCAAKVKVIPNGLDLDVFDPARVHPLLREELGLAPDAVVFGSHGRVLRKKGYVEMVRAAGLALSTLPPELARRLVFAIVGDTPEDFRVDHVRECRDLARSLGLADRVHLLGFREDVRPYVADFDVAVVPSVYADPLPRAVIESMALGKPVIAFDVGGVGEMLDGAAGSLVALEPSAVGEGASEASVARLADAIARYVRDPALRTRQGSAARERVSREFDARGHAARIQGEILEASARTAS